MIADEIQTGFGRTGKMFAMEHFSVVPDLTCIGKSMGGGIPISGIVGSKEIIDSVPPGGLGGTFGGNPLACAVARKALEVVIEEDLANNAHVLGEKFRAGMNAIIDKFAGGPVGVENLAASLGETKNTIEDIIEPYLIQQGYLQRTQKGRVATKIGLEHFSNEDFQLKKKSFSLDYVDAKIQAKESST